MIMLVMVQTKDLMEETITTINVMMTAMSILVEIPFVAEVMIATIIITLIITITIIDMIIVLKIMYSIINRMPTLVGRIQTHLLFYRIIKKQNRLLGNNHPTDPRGNENMKQCKTMFPP